MKRLLCIVGGMNVGGAETFLMKVYRNIDRTKYQIDFAVAIKGEGAYDNEIKALGGKVYHITPKSESLVRNFYGIQKIVKENHYNYVLRTSQHSLSALELLAAWLGGAKVRGFRSSNSYTAMGSGRKRLVHKICRFMPKWFANVRIAPSTEAAEFMFGKDCIKNKIANIINNGTDLSIYRYNHQSRLKIRREMGIKDDTLVIGHIGRFNQQKNHKFLLEIFNCIRNEKKNTMLLLVGKGELESDIRKQVTTLGLDKQVIFAGVRSDIPAILSAMDVLALPSFYEGMPNVVIEAQATGLPCVISDTITREADITGLVEYIPLGQMNVWVEKILSVVTPERPNTYDDFIEQHYDMDSVVDDFVRIIFT